MGPRNGPVILDFSDLHRRRQQRRLYGRAAGQLLCAGASLTPVLRPDARQPLRLESVATFKQKSITDGSGTYGWNDWYNPATQQWEELTLTSGDPPYDTEAFSGMFS